MALRSTNPNVFDLVTAGHHFLIHALPFREPDTRQALATFAETVRRCDVPSVDIDGVLLRCLRVLGRHDTRRVPSLVERYLLDGPVPGNELSEFVSCVENVLAYHSVRNGSVQQALEFINTRFYDSNCTPRVVARAVGLRLSTLCVLFKRHTGHTMREHIRTVRLGQAAALLSATSKSVKEVWVDVGYTHASNFDHDFKHSFHMTPSQYRVAALRPAAHDTYIASAPARCETTHRASGRPIRVLIIDGDETSRTIITSYLNTDGYHVTTAGTGADGLTAITRSLPDVILLDHRLPDMSGVRVVRTIRDDMAHCATPIVLFTADLDLLADMETLRHLGAVPVSKLCDLEHISDTIGDLSAGTRTSRDDLAVAGAGAVVRRATHGEYDQMRQRMSRSEAGAASC